MAVVVIANVVVTLFLTGMIWVVQLLHYPLFPLVGPDGFADYEAAHSTRITWVIVVPWAVQGVTTAWLLLDHPAGVDRWLVLVGAVAAAVTVVVTVAASVPAHGVLTDGFDAAAHARLVATNWLRTAAWTVGGAAALAILWQYRGATAP